MNKSKINIITLGCSKNLVDSEMLLNQLDLNGYEVVHDSVDDDANIVILNTCGFIADAKEESINTILNFVDARKSGDIDKLLVMGCLSGRYKEEMQAEMPEVDKFYGKFDFKSILNDLNAEYYDDKFYHRIKTTPSHFAYLKISEGCNRKCSFCAIPQFTGKHTSRTIESLLAEAERLAQSGVKELLVIAQDLSYYGIDLYGESKLAELIEKLAQIKGVEWIRLHYTHPSNFPLDLLRVMRENDNVANYLDIPLQHASSSMLKTMHRGINREQTIELIQKIRNEVPGIALRTTYLVGHPGETEEDYQELKQFIHDYPMERMGVFAYSNEDDTYAAKNYEDNIPQEIKEERAEELMAIQQEISAKFNYSLIGKKLRVLVDSEEEDFFMARTEYDSPEVDCEVFLEKNTQITVGNFYDVEIVDAIDFDLFAEILE
ncbi:MAG: 30S ribosomal protein S12 methylthiotransferase RimO [Mangrovibacterium sp.]